MKAFGSGFLDPLGEAIEARDVKKFETAFKAAQQACNACHAAAGFAFIRYELPKEFPSPLSSKP